MKHLTAKDFKTTNWSGGTTTELFIWPEDSSYALRNFDFRISTATVEVETSEFTPLEGVKRTLLVLEGEMKLIHEGQHSKTLKPFEQDTFQGGWKTRSEGTCTDFNLMCRGEVEGTIQHLSIGPEGKIDVQLKGQMSLIYVVRGVVTCESKVVSKKELLIFDGDTSNTSLFGVHGTEVLLIEIEK